MRAQKHSGAEDDTEVNLTPMLDVVFILLIFFIVTASFIKEAGIDVLRPDAVLAEARPQANILIAIGRTNEVWIERQRVDVRAVRPIVERLLAENPKGSVVIQADEESDHGTFVKVLDAAKQAGAEQISVAAEKL